MTIVKEKIKQIMTTFLNKMPKYDKLLHFFIGFIIFVISTIFFTNILSLVIVIVIGLSKELIDKFVKKSEIDPVDFTYTILSGLILTMLSYIN